MNKRWLKAMARAWFLLLGWLVMGAAVAAPDYVTAWPRQVPIEQPDPVLGDKPYWEHWVYSESFARRFAGTTDGQKFSVEKADPELKGKLHALVLRIYKTNFWDYLNKDYPEQYACEIEVYFDAGIEIPLKDTRRATPGKARRPEQKPGPHLLIALDEQERETIRQSRPAGYPPYWYPAIFALPTDGRYYSTGMNDYYPRLVPGMAFVRLIVGRIGNDHCPVAAPLHTAGSEWLSLKGIHPYRPKERINQPDSNSFSRGDYDRKYEGLAFDPGPDPESQGLFRIPRAFHDIALQKAALVKMLNWCINQRFAGEQRNAKQRMPDVWREIDRRCSNAEKNGIIDPGYPGKEGLQEYGY